MIILFEGGIGTDHAAFREAGVPAGILATLGVVITAAVVAAVAWLVMDTKPTTALLLGSVVASTDAAAVFAALRSEPLPQRTRRLLQLESGLNDPVAVLMTIGMVEVWRGDPGVLDWALFLLLQLGVGVVAGLAMGAAGRWIVARVTGAAASSLGVITLAIAALSYGGAAVLGGSGFLAVYLTGVVVAGNQRSTRAVLYFHEGLAATAQAVLFLLLGILVFPTGPMDDLGLAVVLAAALILLARPLAVVAVLSWSRTPMRRMAVISRRQMGPESRSSDGTTRRSSRTAPQHWPPATSCCYSLLGNVKSARSSSGAGAASPTAQKASARRERSWCVNGKAGRPEGAARPARSVGHFLPDGSELRRTSVDGAASEGFAAPCPWTSTDVQSPMIGLQMFTGVAF